MTEQKRKTLLKIAACAETSTLDDLKAVLEGNIAHLEEVEDVQPFCWAYTAVRNNNTERGEIDDIQVKTSGKFADFMEWLVSYVGK